MVAGNAPGFPDPAWPQFVLRILASFVGAISPYALSVSLLSVNVSDEALLVRVIGYSTITFAFLVKTLLGSSTATGILNVSLISHFDVVPGSAPAALLHVLLSF